MNDDAFRDPARLPDGFGFLAGGGAATRLILARDWTGHPLGPPAGWPDILKSTLSAVLNSPESMILCWGADELTFFFNETYFPLLGPRLDWAMGSPFTRVWADAWEQAKPIIDDAFAGHSQRFIDLPWKLDTDRGPADTWFTFSYSRILDPQGGVAGLLIFTNETTGRVLADAAARESADRLRLETERQRRSLQQMPGFAAILSGPQHVFDYVNDAYVAVAGVRDYLGQPVRAVFPELEGQGYFEELDRVYRTGETFQARAMPLILDDGRVERYIDHSYTPIRDDAGAITGIFAGGYDVTDRVRAEMRRDALLQLDDRLRDVADTADASYAASEVLGKALGVARVGYGTLDFDAGTITVERNWSAPGFAAVAGVHRFADYGTYLDELRRGSAVVITDVDSDARTAGHRDAMHALGIRAFMDVVVIEQGRPVAQLFVHSATPRAWTEGEIAFARDFAERTRTAIARRRAEQAQRASEARLANAVATAQLGTFSWNAATGVVEIDARGRAIFGLPATGPVDQADIFDRIAPDQIAAVQIASQRAVEHGEGVDYDYDIVLPDGSGRFVSSSAVPFVDGDGQRIMTGVFQDLTGIKQAERTLREYNETLSARVAERTAALEAAHEQLRQAQKMEAVGQLTGGLAHDFNNLLTGMMGNLELLAMRLSQGRFEQLDRFVVAAQGAGRRAAALTQRLLAFSRRQTLDPKPTDVNRLVAGIEDLLCRTVGPATDIVIAAAAGLWNANIDAGQLENALLNLCINARDAMPDGGRITIATANVRLDEAQAREHDLAAGEYLSICVTDTGTGMSPETIERAFEPFYTTKPLGEGTGLGLSMIYGFARQSNGQAHIRSMLGEGTTICIYLPRYRGDAPAPEDEHAAGPAMAAAGQTVLVVDDEATIRHLIDEVLDDLGYTVIGAADGAAGIKVLQSGARIELLITDVGLPNGMNGRQVADAARAIRPGLKVLFITGYAENVAVGNGHLDPGMALLTKPFTLEALAAKVAEMMRGS